MRLWKAGGNTMKKYRAAGIAFLALAFAGCSNISSSSLSGPVVYFKPQQTSSGLVYRSIPFPNDLYISGKSYSSGSFNAIAPSTDPNLSSRTALNNILIPAMNQIKGFGTSSAVLFSVSGNIDMSSLPQTVQASTQPTASAFIINIDQNSPDYGKLTPAVFIFTATSYNGTDYLYTLGIKPGYGYPLDQATKYAVVITTKVKGPNGAGLSPDADFNTIKTSSVLSDPLLEQARQLYAPLFSILAKPPYNLGYKDIAGATVFTTEQITPVIQDIISWLTTTALPNPSFASIAITSGTFTSNTFSYTTGEFTSPSYLTDPVSGSIQVDATNHTPILQGWSTLYFSVTVPATPPPPGGYPVAIVQHGLGSDRGQIILAVADEFAQHGIACISINAVDHGDRTPPGTNATYDFLNFGDPFAIRDHFIQTVTDIIQLSRLVQNISLTTQLSAIMGRPFSFDTTGNLNPSSYIGQSLGGIIGSFYIGVAPFTKNAVINVGAGELSSLLMNSPVIYTEFMPIIETILSIPSWITPSLATDEVMMFQSLIDPGDPINYGRFALKQPLSALGFTKQILFQMADLDQLVPHLSTEGEATAMGITEIARGDTNPLIIVPWFTFTTYTPPLNINGIYQFNGTHGMLNTPTDTVRYSETYPFTPLPQPLTITNPMIQVQRQAAEFLTTGTIINPYLP